MKMETKRLLFFVLIVFNVCMLMACGKSDYKVENEQNAQTVYTCSNDNMLGLEKVVVFQDRVIAVFDKDKCDNSQFGGLEGGVGSDKKNTSVKLTNLMKYKTKKSTIIIDGNKYIATTEFEYEDEDKVDPDADVEVEGVYVMERSIEFNNGNIRLFCSIPGGDCFDDYWQDYDKSSNKWGEIGHELVGWPLIEE